MENKKIEILDILLILVKYKKFLLITTLVVSILSVIYIMTVDQYWKSTTTFLPIQEHRSAMPLTGSQILGAGMSMFGQQIQANALDMIRIMNSRTFSESIIEKFDLIEYFEIDETDEFLRMERALERLHRGMKELNMDRETGMITLTIESKDRHLSAEIANHYFKKLNIHNLESRMTKGRQQREFIEARLESVKLEIDNISRDINEFQKKHNVFDFDFQVKNLAEIYVELVSKQIATEIELDYSREFLGESAIAFEQLQAKNKAFKEKISKIEYIEQRDNKKFILNMKDIPDLALEYMELALALEIQKNIYTFLYPQFEEAKIQEIKDLPTIELIDKAVPAGQRSRPRRAQFCVTVFIITVLILSIIVVVVDRLQALYAGENRAKIDELKKNLKF